MKTGFSLTRGDLHGDWLRIITRAEMWMANEIDAAQERGEVAVAKDKLRHGPVVPQQNNGKATTVDMGLSRKEIHEARIIRDAGEADRDGPQFSSRT